MLFYWSDCLASVCSVHVHECRLFSQPDVLSKPIWLPSWVSLFVPGCLPMCVQQQIYVLAFLPNNLMPHFKLTELLIWHRLTTHKFSPTHQWRKLVFNKLKWGPFSKFKFRFCEAWFAVLEIENRHFFLFLRREQQTDNRYVRRQCCLVTDRF